MRALPYVWLLIGAGLSVLLAFPLYLHEGLTRPLQRLLDGVRRAARGHLDEDVPVGARDEIGLLTEDFNRMTGSLRAAEDALRRYADELEDRVEARTAELATSLDDLKARRPGSSSRRSWHRWASSRPASPTRSRTRSTSSPTSPTCRSTWSAT